MAKYFYQQKSQKVKIKTVIQGCVTAGLMLILVLTLTIGRHHDPNDPIVSAHASQFHETNPQTPPSDTPAGSDSTPAPASNPAPAPAPAANPAPAPAPTTNPAPAPAPATPDK